MATSIEGSISATAQQWQNTARPDSVAQADADPLIFNMRTLLGRHGRADCPSVGCFGAAEKQKQLGVVPLCRSARFPFRPILKGGLQVPAVERPSLEEHSPQCARARALCSCHLRIVPTCSKSSNDCQLPRQKQKKRVRIIVLSGVYCGKWGVGHFSVILLRNPPWSDNIEKGIPR